MMTQPVMKLRRLLNTRLRGTFPRGVLLSFSSSRWSEVGWPRFVEGAVSEHGEQDVGSASGQSDDGLVVAFAFGSFLVVVRAGSGIAFDRSESGEEQHTLEDFVAAP